MEIKEYEDLSKYTTIKIGGIAKHFYIPESVYELQYIVKKLDKYWILGGGSNLLINDQDEFDNVIYLKKMNNDIQMNGDCFYVGASVSNQKLINYINEKGYGGIEYLYSVPGLIGGAVVMNAGRGKKFNKSISDYLVKVEVLIDGEVIYLTKEQCKFSYRNSIFKNNSKYIIIGAYFIFDKQSIDISNQLKKERMDLCKKVQDVSKPNFGTFCCESNYRIMKILSTLTVGYKSGCHFSKKTVNWILNEGNGNYLQIKNLIKITKIFHKLLNKNCEVEVIVWSTSN